MSIRVLLAAAILAFAGAAAAQSGDGARGSIPPGESQDGSRPSEGAVTGGAILPGESGGMPAPGVGSGVPSDRAASRCHELSGTLREQCLREIDAAAGGTRGLPAGRDPRTAPPPHNPRQR